MLIPPHVPVRALQLTAVIDERLEQLVCTYILEDTHAILQTTAANSSTDAVAMISYAHRAGDHVRISLVQRATMLFLARYALAPIFMRSSFTHHLRRATSPSAHNGHAHG